MAVWLLAITLGTGALVYGFLRRLSRSPLQAGAVFLWPFPWAGALAVVPGFVLYAVLGALIPRTSGGWGDVLFTWTINAPAEEVAKYLCFVAAATAFRSLREPQDGVLQGAATGLGFALVENFLYGLSGGWELLLLRTFVSLPGHVIYGAVWGGYHGFEVYQGRGKVRRWSVPLLALVPAAFAHALFNTLVLVRAPLEAALFGDLLTLGFGAFLFTRLRALSPSLRRRPLRQWKTAIPETEHALALQPDSTPLRRRLAAYYLVGGFPQKALSTLAPLDDEPWTLFYREAAWRKLGRPGPLPPEASLDPRLFRLLSGS